MVDTRSARVSSTAIASAGVGGRRARRVDTRRRPIEVCRLSDRRGRRAGPGADRAGVGSWSRTSTCRPGSPPSSSAPSGSTTARASAPGFGAATNTRRSASGRRPASSTRYEPPAHVRLGRQRPRQPVRQLAVRPRARSRRRPAPAAAHGSGPAPSGLTMAITAMPDKEERIVARRLGEYRGEHARHRRGHQAARRGRGG